MSQILSGSSCCAYNSVIKNSINGKPYLIMHLLTEEEQEHVMYAISVAENRTSGEIRVVVERTCKEDVMTRATAYFHHLEMHKTSLHHGVLIYVAIDDHKFAVIGDKGIHEKVAADFWEKTKGFMVTHFRNDDLVSGLIAGIEHAGEQLRTYFPRTDDNVNELPDDIVFGDGRALYKDK